MKMDNEKNDKKVLPFLSKEKPAYFKAKYEKKTIAKENGECILTYENGNR